jgi:hypothetical protein
MTALPAKLSRQKTSIKGPTNAATYGGILHAWVFRTRPFLKNICRVRDDRLPGLTAAMDKEKGRA